MFRLRAFIAMAVLMGEGLFLSYASSTSSATLTSAQLIQHSMEATRSTTSVHSQSRVHINGPALSGKTSETIAASVSVDCTGTRHGSRFTSALRSTIRGRYAVRHGSSGPVNMHYIFLESGSSSGKTHNVVWQRDATKTNRWRKTLVTTDAAYSAYLFSFPCASGGFAFRVAQGMPDVHLDAPAVATLSGRSVWTVSGTSGPGAARFSFRLLIDRGTYRLDGYSERYVERINGHVVARKGADVTYSKFGVRFGIKAPNAGSS